MQKHFNLIKEHQIDKWKSKGLSNQYLDTFGIISDLMLSKPIKPMYAIFKGKGTTARGGQTLRVKGTNSNLY